MSAKVLVVDDEVSILEGLRALLAERPGDAHVQNALGYTRRDYEGAMSTLCAGCGHDSVTAARDELHQQINAVDQDVEAAKGRQRAFDQPGQRIAFRDVAGDAAHPVALPRQDGFRLGHIARIFARHDDIRA